MKVKFKSNKGITLVALIITIIVLLILAMVSISLVMNGGIIGKSKSAVDKYSQEEIEEQIKLAYSEWQMGQYSGETRTAAEFMQTKLNSIYGTGTVTNVELENGVLIVELINGKAYTYNVATGVAAKVKTVDEYPVVTATTNNSPVPENSKYLSNNKTAVIPVGYAISNEESEQSIDTGLVISKDGNEWVWIPVADVTDLYTENTSNTEWILCGTSGDNKVVTPYKSKSEILTGLTRTTPGTTTDPYYREPDTVVGDGTQYDAVQANYEAAGFSSLNDMATKLRDDYKKMIDSVRKYGGFYVGRYELSNAGTKKNQSSLNTNWYNLYKKCMQIDNTGVKTRMIWGCQWEQTCKFISSGKDANGDIISLTDSTKYGNYANSQSPANTGNYSQGNKKNTGSNEAWKINNIYDFAGNCQEWTQEAVGHNNRAICGGCYGYNGENRSITCRYSNFPHDSCVSYGSSSRPVLYIK